MIYVAALTENGTRRGDVVDVSAWALPALTGALRLGRLHLRLGDRLYRPRAASLACGTCGLPYAGHADLDAHERAAHGYRGGGGTDPAPALVEVVTEATTYDLATLAAGSCPWCGLPDADEVHVLDRHPDVRVSVGLPRPQGSSPLSSDLTPGGGPARAPGVNQAAP